MADIACIESSWYLTTAFEDPEIQEAVRRLKAENAAPEEFIEVFASHAPAPVAGNLRLEFRELPEITFACIIESWLMASRAGKGFSVESVRPEQPLVFARNRRVRVAVEADESAVRVIISHVASRHATWYGSSAKSA